MVAHRPPASSVFAVSPSEPWSAEMLRLREVLIPTPQHEGNSNRSRHDSNTQGRLGRHHPPSRFAGHHESRDEHRDDVLYFIRTDSWHCPLFSASQGATRPTPPSIIVLHNFPLFSRRAIIEDAQRALRFARLGRDQAGIGPDSRVLHRQRGGPADKISHRKDRRRVVRGAALLHARFGRVGRTREGQGEHATTRDGH